MRVEAKLEDLGLVLREPMRVPPGLRMPFSWVRVSGSPGLTYSGNYGTVEGEGASVDGELGAGADEYEVAV